MVQRRLTLSGFALSLAVALQGCSDGDSCDDALCPVGAVCSSGVCLAQCNQDDECQRGFMCVAGTCQGGTCGNGQVDGREACDDGLLDSSYDGCGPNCQRGPHCGDGVITDAEECDSLMPSDEYGGCQSDCTWAPRCGDGVVQSPHEVCDAATVQCADLGPEYASGTVACVACQAPDTAGCVPRHVGEIEFTAPLGIDTAGCVSFDNDTSRVTSVAIAWTVEREALVASHQVTVKEASGCNSPDASGVVVFDMAGANQSQTVSGLGPLSWYEVTITAHPVAGHTGNSRTVFVRTSDWPPYSSYSEDFDGQAMGDVTSPFAGWVFHAGNYSVNDSTFPSACAAPCLSDAPVSLDRVLMQYENTLPAPWMTYGSENWRDYAIEMVIGKSAFDNDEVQLWVRADGGSQTSSLENGYFFFFNTQSTPGLTHPGWAGLYRVDDGVETKLVDGNDAGGSGAALLSWANTWNTADSTDALWFRIRLEVVGETLALFLGVANQPTVPRIDTEDTGTYYAWIPITDGGHPSGRIAVAFVSQRAWVDDIVIEPL